MAFPRQDRKNVPLKNPVREAFIPVRAAVRQVNRASARHHGDFQIAVGVEGHPAELFRTVHPKRELRRRKDVVPVKGGNQADLPVGIFPILSVSCHRDVTLVRSNPVFKQNWRIMLFFN
ncbi:hypothetical protein SDC9_205898 [bioreactor metagenome]|uniref:Uncharacterized protein n=1 Tax=bioreactor metagenome TaxID=1076179 RepID=A0A645J478_9ZZZZ